MTNATTQSRADTARAARFFQLKDKIGRQWTLSADERAEYTALNRWYTALANGEAQLLNEQMQQAGVDARNEWRC